MALREDVLQPIAGPNPGGENLRYAPVFDKIKDARREDDDAPQGDWQRERKAADFTLVIKLAGDALAEKSKDLQLGAWLTEALLRKEGFAGLQRGLEVLRGLVADFWDTLYPEIEDGDVEMRAAPLEWVGNYLVDSVKKVPLTRSGLGFFKYKESRAVGYEEQANESESRRIARETAIAEKKTTAEEFDTAVNNTPTAAYESWAESLEKSLETLDALNDLCAEKFGQDGPSFSKLRGAVEEVQHTVKSLLQPKLEQEGRGAVKAEETPDIPSWENSGSGAAAATARAPASRSVSGLEPADAEEAGLRLAAVAKFLRQADGTDPSPYLILRGFRWGELRKQGENPDPSFLAAPAKETRQLLRRLLSESSWAELIEAAETAMAEPCGRAWLDLQRYVVKACEDYGYPAAATAIRSELKALLADIPALPSWTLDDDTPCANGETQTWLTELSGPAKPTAFEPQYPQESRETKAEGEFDAYDLAMAKMKAGRADEAVQILAEDILLQSSGRGRFQRKVQFAQLCLASNRDTIAYPILEELVESIDLHHLEAWEPPETIAHALTLLYRCLERAQAEAPVKQKIYARICRLDPVHALSFVK